MFHLLYSQLSQEEGKLGSSNKSSLLKCTDNPGSELKVLDK
jgi:hypothetical protein